ncbi:ribonuclease H1 domain-containing protein [Thermophagus sp. OGC60D27]|uniref:ribonuclease H1 domain-containing protein n=1 Tax=Thermophagus sp. OGC60D27 TaxID=3458415 RepID=UPI004037C0D7
MAAKTKYYVIWVGHKTGIVDNWEECNRRIKGYKGARYKSYKTLAEAQKAYESPWSDNIATPHKKALDKAEKKLFGSKPILESLAVDAACSGNPGPMEYRGVHVKTKEVWFHVKFPLGTNNIGEFLAIVHGLAELKRRNVNIPIYSDSRTAMSWVKKKKCTTLLERNKQTEQLFKMIHRAEVWLQNNNYQQPLLKWETENWGEIPADFGRK